MAEPIEMPFGLLSRMHPRNHVLDVGADLPEKGVILGVFSPPHWKAFEAFAAVYAKTAEPIEMPFVDWLMLVQNISESRSDESIHNARCDLIVMMRPFVKIWPLASFHNTPYARFWLHILLT